MSDLDILSILLIALALSADCFAVALGGSIAMKTISAIQISRTALTFGIFQATMPVLGWLAGKTILDLIAGYDHWVAFILLTLAGGRMIWGSFRTTNAQRADITDGALLLTLAIATSIDALAVGLTFAFLRLNIPVACVTIGIVTCGITVAGFILGRKTGKLLGKRAELFGGLILIGIGIRTLLSHTL